MGFLDELTSTQKMIGVGILGAGALLLFSRGGGGQPGMAVVDVRRPTDDMNAPGAAWGADYATFAEINQSNNELLRTIWQGQNAKSPITNVPDSGMAPPSPGGDAVIPRTPAPGMGPMGPWDKRSLIGDLKQRARINDLRIRQIREDGVTGNEKAALMRIRKGGAAIGQRLEDLGAPIPQRDPRAPGPPTPRPGKGEVVR